VAKNAAKDGGDWFNSWSGCTLAAGLPWEGRMTETLDAIVIGAGPAGLAAAAALRSGA